MQKSELTQSLLVTHFEDTTFQALEANNGAPRPQFLYRQLGVEQATGGAYDAHVIKGVAGSRPPIPSTSTPSWTSSSSTSSRAG